MNEGDFQCVYYTSCGRIYRTPNALLRHLSAAHVPANERAGAGKFKEFKASNGWVDRFKDRHNLHNVAMCGEKGSCDYEGAEIVRFVM